MSYLMHVRDSFEKTESMEKKKKRCGISNETIPLRFCIRVGISNPDAHYSFMHNCSS